MHGRRESIIGRLAFVDVIIRMQHLLFVRQLAALNDVPPVGHHLIDVHIGLRAGSGLPHHQWELIIEFAVQDLITNLTDQFGFVFGKYPQVMVGQGSCFFQDGESTDNFLRHLLTADLEVFGGTLGLGSPVLFGRYVYITDAVFFLSKSHNSIFVRSVSMDQRSVRAGKG